MLLLAWLAATPCLAAKPAPRPAKPLRPAAHPPVAAPAAPMDAPAAADPGADAAAGPAAPAAGPAGVRGEEALALAVGAQQELLVAEGLERLAIGDPALADAMVLRGAPGTPGARVIVTGKAPGRTTLLLWPRGAQAAVRRAVQVSALPAGPLDGAAPQARVEVAGRALALAGSLPDARAHREAMAVLSQSAGAAAAGPSGGAPGAAAAGRVGIVDRSDIAVRSGTVQVDVKVVEFSRSLLKAAGINLVGTRSNGFAFAVASPGSLRNYALGGDNGGAQGSGAGGAGFETQSPVAQAFNLLLGFRKAGIVGNLAILEGNGLARVLAEPTLVALSGQSASFLAGGEIPVPVPQGLGTVSIQYKPFGVGLTLTPTVLSEDRIALKVAPEASDLDFTNALSINGATVPALTTRRVDTMVELGDGESFVIGGLVSRSTASNVDKVPLLGDLPILGAFFKRQTYQQNEKELVIVVTPRLVQPIARGAELAPLLPGRAEQREPRVWAPWLLGGAAQDAMPGFSR
ncbi:MAG: type II and III secretion system protein family protein [Xylophilus ampelinus]